MQGCSISDPYPLASYSLATSGSSRSKRHPVALSATFTPVSGSDIGWATITAQGDGIHIIDLASSQPTASHTLGPSTYFSCPSVSIVSSEGGKQTRTTFAAVEPDKQRQSSEVWFWKDEVSQSLSTSASKKQVVKLEHEVSTLLTLPGWDHVLAISSNARYSTLDLSGKCVAKGSLTSQSDATLMIRAWLFKRADSSFLPSSLQSSTASAVLCSLLQSPSGGTEVSLHLVDRDGSLHDGSKLSLHTEEDIKDATLLPSGDLSILNSSGIWTYFQLTPQMFASTPTTLTAQATSQIPAHSHPTPTILPLTSSHVIIATTTSTSKSKLSLQLEIRDLRYPSLVLATFNASLPSTTSWDHTTGSGGPVLRLVGATSSQAILTISPPAIAIAIAIPTPTPTPTPLLSPPKTSKGAKSTSVGVDEDMDILQAGSGTRKSHVLVVPFIVPEESSLAMAIMAKRLNLGSIGASSTTRGQGQLTAVQGTATRSGGGSGSSSIESTLEGMRIAMRGSKLDDAIAKFWNWVDNESEASEHLKAKKKFRPSRGRDHLPYAFATGSITILCSALKTREAWTIVRPAVEYLVKRRFVTNRLLEDEQGDGGGVVRNLGDRGDWELVKICLVKLPDIPEAEIIRLLRRVFDVASSSNNNKKTRTVPSNANEDQMVVDVDTNHTPTTPTTTTTTTTANPQDPGPNSSSSSSSSFSKESYTPTLPPSEFLAQALSYPMSPALVRPALRKYFGSDARALFPVLRMLNKWVEGIVGDEKVELGWVMGGDGDPGKNDATTTVVGTGKGAEKAYLAHNPKRVDLLNRVLVPLDDDDDDGSDSGDGDVGGDGEGRNVMKILNPAHGQATRVKKGSVFSVAQVDYHRRPPFVDILSFTEQILDTSFLTLIQYPPAQNVLLSLATVLQTHVDRSVGLGKITGQLKPFAVAEKSRRSRAAMRRKDVKNQAEKGMGTEEGVGTPLLLLDGGERERVDVGPGPGPGGRRERRKYYANDSAVVGVYQVEELEL